MGRDLAGGNSRASTAPFLNNSRAHPLPPTIQVSCFEELAVRQTIFNTHRRAVGDGEGAAMPRCIGGKSQGVLAFTELFWGRRSLERVEFSLEVGLGHRGHFRCLPGVTGHLLKIPPSFLLPPAVCRLTDRPSSLEGDTGTLVNENKPLGSA